MNVDEYDEAGTRIFRWCFLPVGNLVRGDVLLAQKLALELFVFPAKPLFGGLGGLLQGLGFRLIRVGMAHSMF